VTTRAVCPGSFDPVTHGHLDIIERTARLASEVIVAVGGNMAKNALFTPEERVQMLQAACTGWDNVSVMPLSGLLVDFCAAHDANVISKGVRAADFDYELQMAQMNHRLTGLETLFVATNPEYSFLSSSLVKEVAKFGGDVTGLVPDPVLHRLARRLGHRDPSG
jgi:pantetheine-phosphate adenylyltransferase